MTIQQCEMILKMKNAQVGITNKWDRIKIVLYSPRGIYWGSMTTFSLKGKIINSECALQTKILFIEKLPVEKCCKSENL